MPKFATRKAAPSAKKRGRAKRGSTATVSTRAGGTGKVRTGEGRFETVMGAAERSGLLSEKSSRIAGRVSPALVKEAKKRTGIEADTDLIEFALANVALEDNFPETFKDARGKVDPGLKLGF
jgi:hypothetical protein